jgi:hypothetical protein
VKGNQCSLLHENDDVATEPGKMINFLFGHVMYPHEKVRQDGTSFSFVQLLNMVLTKHKLLLLCYLVNYY